MIDENFNVLEYKGNFGVEKDEHGNLLTPIINIRGIEVSEDMFKDCLLMACSRAAETQGVEDESAGAFILDALTIWPTLEGLDIEQAEVTAATTLGIMEEQTKGFHSRARWNPEYAPKTDEFTPKYE